MTISKAIIPIAGFGTRFSPITKTIPKEMLPVFNKPLIHYAYEELAQIGIEEIILITNNNSQLCLDYFNHNQDFYNVANKSNLNHYSSRKIKIKSVEQQEMLGLGHAIWCARSEVNETFIVLLPDEISFTSNCLKKMISIYNENLKSNIISVNKIEASETMKYGVIDYHYDNNSLLVTRIVEKPTPVNAPSNLAISGKYILQPEIFSYLEKIIPGKNNEIQLTDALDALCRVQTIYAYEDDEPRYDCGNPIDWLNTNIAYAIHHSNDEEQIKKILQKNLDKLANYEIS